MTTTTAYTVTGMTCSHCELSVADEVTKVAGVAGVDVDRQTGRLTVKGDEALEPSAVISAVEEAGYEAELTRQGGRR